MTKVQFVALNQYFLITFCLKNHCLNFFHFVHIVIYMCVLCSAIFLTTFALKKDIIFFREGKLKHQFKWQVTSFIFWPIMSFELLERTIIYLSKQWKQSNSNFNRHGVAGAVIQIPLSLIKSVTSPWSKYN